MPKKYTNSNLNEETLLGDNVRLTLVRSEPALGRCLVTWKAESVSGHSVQKGINITRGEVEFESGKTSGHISLHINKDDEPEARERYKIVLTDVQTSGTLRNFELLLAG